MKKKQEMPQIDITRYKLEEPSDTSADAWNKALDNGQSQVQHQAIRCARLAGIALCSQTLRMLQHRKPRFDG